MDKAFQRAFTPHTFTVMGLRMEPLSLGHLLLLDSIESGFADGSGGTAADLIASAFICSQPHEAASKSLRSAWGGLFMRVWGWVLRFRKFNLALEAAKFQSYVAHFKTFPKAKPANGNGQARELTTPEEWRLLAMLMADFGFTERDALNCPMNRAACYWVAEGDRRGTLETFGERRSEFWDHVARLEREKASQQN